MGRHSVTYIAQQRVQRPTVTSAASHVGRVGGLALALGISAAVAGGAGVAHADDSSDKGSSTSADHGSQAPSSGDERATPSGGAAGPEAPSDSASPSSESTSAPTSPNVRKPKLGHARDTSTDEEQDATAGPASLPKLLATVPRRIATALTPHASASPTALATPRNRSSRDDTAATGQAESTETGPTADDDPADDSATNATATDNAEADAITGHVQPVRLVASTPTPTPTSPTVTSVVVDDISPSRTTRAPANPIAMVVSNVLTALNIGSTGGSPGAPLPIVHAVLQLIHREIERFTLSLGHVWPTATPVSIPTNPVPSVASGVPTPTDEAQTAYGDIGTWMLESDGQIADYGGLPYGGRTVLEPVNVIIVDPTSASAAESAAKLDTAMFWSGFPAQPFHSTGFEGTIDDVTYGQQPTGFLSGFSDNFFLFTNNHGRFFGPDPVEVSTGTGGYVWSGSFSTEQFVIYELQPTHKYVSSNVARNALAKRLIGSGQATYGGMVPLNNSYDDATTTTGDHDGYAVVVVLK